MCQGITNLYHFYVTLKICKFFFSNFTFFEPCVVIYLRNKNSQNAHILYYLFHLIIVFRNTSNIQIFILRKTCTCSFTVFLTRICSVQAVRSMSGCTWTKQVSILPSTCFKQPSVHFQEDFFVQAHPDIDHTACTDAWKKNTIKLHLKDFLRTNTWMFETCRRHFNLSANECTYNFIQNTFKTL